MALTEQQRGESRRRIGEILVSMRAISEARLLETLSRQLEVPLVDLNQEPPDQEVLKMVPNEFAIRHLLIPIRRTEERLVVAMADPLDIQAIDDLHLLTGLDIAPMLASAADIRRVCEQ